MGPFLGVKRDRSVTLTTHPIYCRSHEWVGSIHPLPPSSFVACNGTAFFFLVVSLHNNLLHLPHQCITALLALGADVGFEQHVSIVKQPSSDSHLHFVHTQFSMPSNVKIYYLINLCSNTRKSNVNRWNHKRVNIAWRFQTVLSVYNNSSSSGKFGTQCKKSSLYITYLAVHWQEWELFLPKAELAYCSCSWNQQFCLPRGVFFTDWWLNVLESLFCLCV
jgi:hypothetical protein